MTTRSVRGLKQKIVIALGLTPATLLAAGCVGRPIEPVDSMGGGDDAAADDDIGDDIGDDGASSTSGVGTGDDMGDGTSEDDGPPPVPPATSVGSDTGPPPPVQMCWPSDSWLEAEAWIPLDAGAECVCDAACESALLESYWGGSCEYFVDEVLCIEALEGQCHVVATVVEDWCGKGRPLLVDDRARLANVRARDDWADVGALPAVDDLAAEQRSALADYWTDAALAEHASVASFARFALDLVALGAPPELVADCAAAMQDEARHAQLAFTLAGAYAERKLGPGPIPMHGVAAGKDPEAIVRAAVREGCVEETLAAAEAELASRRATDGAVRTALKGIAEDEGRHAVLAWRFVRWALEKDPSLASAVRDELASACAAVERSALPTPDRLPTDLGSSHGVLPGDIRRRVRAACLQDTVRECGSALLASVRSAPTPGSADLEA